MLSEWSPTEAAITSQHGNNAVLTQNAIQAITKVTRASRHGPPGCLVLDSPLVLRVNDHVVVNLHLCQESLDCHPQHCFYTEPSRLSVRCHTQTDRLKSRMNCTCQTRLWLPACYDKEAFQVPYICSQGSATLFKCNLFVKYRLMTECALDSDQAF